MLSPKMKLLFVYELPMLLSFPNFILFLLYDKEYRLVDSILTGYVRVERLTLNELGEMS